MRRLDQFARLICAPYESDAQLVSLQRQGLADRILSEDSDIAHLGAAGGTVLSRCIAWQQQHRHALLQPQTATVRRCLRAALLGTDYTQNKPLVRDWTEVDAVAATLFAELNNREWHFLAECETLKALAAATASRARGHADPVAIVDRFINSVLMFENGPVSELTFNDVTIDSSASAKLRKRHAFRQGEYTAAVVPFNAFRDGDVHGPLWFAQHFADKCDGVDETPFFKAELWARCGGSLAMSVAYTMGDYLKCYGTAGGTLPPCAEPQDVLTCAAFLPFAPELCREVELKEWCKVHLVSLRGNTPRHGNDGTLGYEDVVKRVLATAVNARNLPQTRAFVCTRLGRPGTFR